MICRKEKITLQMVSFADRSACLRDKITRNLQLISTTLTSTFPIGMFYFYMLHYDRHTSANLQLAFLGSRRKK